MRAVSREVRLFELIRVSRIASEFAAPPLHRSKSTARSTESYPTSPDYVLRRATARSPPSDCFRLWKTECRDRSEGFLFILLARHGRDHVARLTFSLM